MRWGDLRRNLCRPCRVLDNVADAPFARPAGTFENRPATCPPKQALTDVGGFIAGARFCRKVQPVLEGRSILSGHTSNVLPGLDRDFLYLFPALNPPEADRTLGYYRRSLRDEGVRRVARSIPRASMPHAAVVQNVTKIRVTARPQRPCAAGEGGRLATESLFSSSGSASPTSRGASAARRGGGGPGRDSCWWLRS